MSDTWTGFTRFTILDEQPLDESTWFGAEARNEFRKVHFASLMDLCHLKNSELEPQFQKYIGPVVLRGDIVKDDSGSYAAFTVQGSSASQLTAPESWTFFQDYQDAQDKQGNEWNTLYINITKTTQEASEILR